jgi:anti-sigma factor RsiW
MDHPVERCGERDEQIVLYACGDLDAATAQQLEAHLAQCGGCAAGLAEEKRLHEALLVGAEEPSAALLAECRMALAAAVEQVEQPGFWSRVWGGFTQGKWRASYNTWLGAHPAWGAAVFVLAGVLIGNLAPRWLQDSRESVAFGNPIEPVVVQDDRDTRPLNVTGVNLASSGSTGQPVFRIEGMRETPLVFEGTADDPRVLRALIGVAGGKGFNADTRMFALEVLRSRSADAEVREALCQAARGDSNPAVRLKAVEALRGFEQDENVRQAMLHVLLRDSNPGVRIEAINALRAMAEAGSGTAAPDQRIVDVLRERMEKDPNTYIRVQSAAAMRQLAQRGVH